MEKPKKKPSRVRRPVPLSPAFVAVAVPAAGSVVTPNPLSLPRPQGLGYIVALFFCAIVPVFGLTLAFFYINQDDRSARNFGRFCLVLALLGWFVGMLSGALKAALGSGEWLVQPYY